MYYVNTLRYFWTNINMRFPQHFFLQEYAKEFCNFFLLYCSVILFFFFFKEWNKECLVFELFNESLFALKQTVTFFSSVFINWNNVSIFFADKKKFASSADMIGVKFE